MWAPGAADMMRAFESPAHGHKPSVQLGSISLEVTDEMRTALGLRSGRRQGLAFLFAVALSLGGLLRSASRASAAADARADSDVQLAAGGAAAGADPRAAATTSAGGARRDAVGAAGAATERAGTAATIPAQSSMHWLRSTERCATKATAEKKSEKKAHGSSRNDTLVLEFSQRKDTPQIVRLAGRPAEDRRLSATAREG